LLLVFNQFENQTMDHKISRPVNQSVRLLTNQL